MTARARPNHPYADAPRLPEGASVSIDALLPGTGPVEIEIGPGRGGFLFERAEAAPEVRLIGLEIRLKWASIVDARLRDRGLGHRARVFAEDAREALARLEPKGSVETVFLHFPDPWWKKRHTKRLFLTQETLCLIAELLRPGGHLFIQTDVVARAEAYHALLGSSPSFAPAGDEGWTLEHNPYGARSPREHRAVADGLPVTRLRARRL